MKLFYFLILCLLVFCFSPERLQGQQARALKADFKAAEYFFLNEEFEDALASYLKILKENPQNANINYRIGFCYLNIPGRKDKAISYLKYASTHISEKYVESTINEVNAPKLTLFLLGTAYQINNDFENAKKAFNDYKGYLKLDDINEINFVEKQIGSCDTASNMMKKPVSIEYEVIRKIIPLNQPAYYPVMSANGEVIVYSSSAKFNCQVWIVKKQTDTWAKGVNITPEIKSDGNCFPVSLSADGTSLYLVKESSFDSDIYVSFYKNGTWSPIKKLDKTINTKYWESYASISFDGKTLYFSSNRKGGFGGLDIYKSVLNNKGQWGPAVNLGKVINTPYNEDNAVITSDEKTLYFSSQGHNTMGGYDIFKSVKKGPDSWSIPANLGYPINTTDDNRYYYPIENGDKALYSGVLNPDDPQSAIKEIRFIPAKTTQIINLKGKLTVQGNLNELNDTFRITILNKETGSLIDSITPNRQTGEFSIGISPGKYLVVYKRSGYQLGNEEISIPLDYVSNEYILSPNLILLKTRPREKVVESKLIQDSLPPQDKTEYTIVLAYTSKRLPAGSYKNLREITGKYLDELYFNGQYAYSIGSFNFKDMAYDYLKHPAFKKITGAKVVNTDEIFPSVPIMDDMYANGVYGIQVMALKRPSDLPGLSNSGLLKAHECTDGFFRYLYCNYNSVEKALQDLQMVKDMGYPNAFVINRNRIKSISLPKIVEKSSGNYTGKYTIQLKAIRVQLGKYYFHNLPNVKVIESDNHISRYIYGEFNTMDEANKELLRVRKMGYIDAFIREIESFPGYK